MNKKRATAFMIPLFYDFFSPSLRRFETRHRTGEKKNKEKGEKGHNMLPLAGAFFLNCWDLEGFLLFLLRRDTPHGGNLGNGIMEG